MNVLKQKGLSLVELIIALGLSSALLLGLFQIFNSNQQAFSLQDGVARVQESGRISMEFLSRNIRAATFLGCASGQETSPFTNVVQTGNYANVQAALNRYVGDGDGVVQNSIAGFENLTAAPAILGNLGIQFGGTTAGEIVQNTDAFIVHGVQACPGTEGRVSATTSSTITAEGSCGLSQNDIVIVSSCAGAQMFAITSDPSAANVFARSSSANVGASFPTDTFSNEGSFLYLPTITAFHVGHTGDGDLGLFQTSLNRSGTGTSFVTQEIARGVEDMQVLYGEDTDDDATVNRYVTADNVTDFDNVLAIRTRLLTRSEDQLAVTNQTYNFNGAAVTATDLRLRVPYETTNTIRNRVN